MFDLNEAIIAWCANLQDHGPNRQARIDELVDHLFCEVEQGKARGLSEQDAFHEATRTLGESEQLANEYQKVETGASKWMAVFRGLLTCDAKSLAIRLNPKELALTVIGVSLFFAGLMIATSHIMADSEHATTATNLWVAVWFVPYCTLTVAAGFRSTEPRCKKEA